MSAVDNSVYQYEDIDYQSSILTAASISLCFACVCPLAYFVYPTLRTSWHVRLLLCLSIADIITSVGHIIPNVTVQSCRLQALFLHYGELSSVMWLCCIALNRCVVLEEKVVAWKYRWMYNSVSWSVPLILSLINLFDSTFGQTDIQCWIPPVYVGHRLLTFHLPILVMLVFFTAWSFRARRLLHRRAKQFGSQLAAQYEYSGRVIVIHAVLLLIIHIPALLHRVGELNNGTATAANTVTIVPRSLSLLHAIFSPLQGLVNILLFASSRHVQRSVHLVKSIGALPLISQITYVMQGADGRLVKALRGVRLLDTAQFDPSIPIIELACPAVSPPQPVKQPKRVTGEVDDANSPYQQHSVFVGTWNVGNSMPPSSLRDWIPADKQYDMYVIGVQECAYKVPGTSIVVYSMSPGGGSNCAEFWYNLVRDAVGDGYTVVAKQSLWHIRLIVLVKSSLMPSVSSVWSGSEACGLGHVLGNKGSVAIAFNVGPLSYCFITCHLNAHSGNAKRRNMDARQILSSLHPCKRDVGSYHCVILCGDLNYRWSGLSTAQVMKCIDNNDLATLYQFDELRCVLQTNSALYGFVDSAVTYMPTYKYLTANKLKKQAGLSALQHDNDADGDVKPPRSSQYTTKRAPAYTDRILYRTRSCVQMEQVECGDIPAVTTSDHRPIYAAYTVAFDSSVIAQSKLSQLQVIGPAHYQAHSRHSSVHRHISIDTGSPQHTAHTFAARCSNAKQINVVLTGVQVYDVFTPSTLPVLEPYLELRLQHSSTCCPTSKPYISQVSLPEYRPYVADTSSQQVLSPVSMYSTAQPLIHRQYSPSHLHQRKAHSRRVSIDGDNTGDTYASMSLQEFTETDRARLAKANESGEQNAYQSFLVAEWYDYCVPQLELTRSTANDIATEWGWTVDQDTLLRVLSASQLALVVRDRYCAGEEEIEGRCEIELRQCAGGDKVPFTAALHREGR